MARPTISQILDSRISTTPNSRNGIDPGSRSEHTSSPGTEMNHPHAWRHPDAMEKLPAEILIEITAHLQPESSWRKPSDINALSQTCRHFYSTTKHLIYEIRKARIYYCWCRDNPSWDDDDEDKHAGIRAYDAFRRNWRDVRWDKERLRQNIKVQNWLYDW